MSDHKTDGTAIPEFQPTDNMTAIRAVAKNYAEKEIRPNVMRFDESQEFPSAVLRDLGRMGFLGVIFDESYGGAGMTYCDYVTVIEEISKVDPSVGLSIAAHNSLCSNHINLFGSEAQKKKYLSPLASGKMIGAWALTEPTSGSDAGGMLTTATKEGDYYILNGSKNFITHGSVAGVTVVMAITDRITREKGDLGIYRRE